MARKPSPKTKLKGRSAKKNAKSPKRRLQIRVFNSMQEADEADQKYWSSRTPEERLRELERLRQFGYGDGQGKPHPRVQRTIRVTKRGESQVPGAGRVR